MHEIRIAEDLVKIVLDTAGSEGLSEVSAVNVSFGQMIQIVPEIFKFAFGETVRGTIAENAELNIEILPVRIKCLTCGNESFIREIFFACENCDSNEVEIIQGKELFVKSIEGE